MKSTLFLLSLLTHLFVGAQVTPTFNDILIPMRDGELLSADVYLPSNVDSCEVILIQTPYNKNAFESGLPLGIGSNINGQPYGFVIVDWRGFYGSSGADLSNFERGEDGYDIIDWIVQQPWHLNRVGTWGPSALGAVQYQTAREQHPNHTCAVPLVAQPQQDYQQYFYGGALEAARLQQLDALGYGLSPIILTNPYYNFTWQFAETDSWYPSDIHIPTLQIGGWYDHNITKMMEWYEATRNNALPAVQNEQWLLVGPWVHGGTGIAFVGSSVQGELNFPNAAGVPNDKALDFFDYYLLDTPNGWNNTDLIQYYNIGNDTWLTSNAVTIDMPLNDILYFNDNQLLTTSNTGQLESSFLCDPSSPSPTIGGQTLSTGLEQGPYDQISLESRPDVLTFQSGVLYADATISGEATATISVSSDQPDGDIVVRLVDVYPNGSNMLINDGIRRIRFRDGYTQTDESFMSSGQIYTVNVTLPFTNYTWKAGHRIKVFISGNSATRWDVNLQNGGPMYQGGSGVVANMTIHHNTNNPSYLSLPGDNSALGTHEASKGNFQVFPNPAKDYVTINGAQNPEYTLLNAQGQEVLSGKGTIIPVHLLPVGWYLLEIHGERHVEQIPFIKE